MAYTLKSEEHEARERLRAFWQGSSLGRPALYVVAERPGFVPCPWAGPTEECKENDLSPEWHARRALNYLEGTVFLAEAMPGTVVRWGSLLVTVAVLAGGDYEFHSNSGWIKPIPNLWDHPLPSFDADGPVAGALERCIEHVAQAVGNRGFVNPPVMLDGMTTLSAFRTPRQLCLDVIESPDLVRQWSDALTTVYLEAYEHFYRLVKALGYGDTTSWLQVTAEGRMEAVQCDFAVMLSPAMYARFAMPDLERLTGYMDYSLYHLDGTCQMRFLDLLRGLPRLNGIQWNPEPGAGSPVQWLDAYREIRKHGFSLYVGCDTLDEALQITGALGPDGLMLVLPRFPTVAEAEDAIARIQACC